MKKYSMAGAITSTLMLLTIIVPSGERVFRGEIMDSLCAETGSHNVITKLAESAKECTNGCVSSGATYVLYGHGMGSAFNHAFKLDDQRKPIRFAGEKVVVIGTYDKETNTIHVRSIQGASNP